MLIGLDFDNTIVNYDGVFCTVAREKGWLEGNTPASKRAVRDKLREMDQEDLWTTLQGYVYGARMQEATPYPGVISFIKKFTQNGHQCVIVSHKTRHPYLGYPYDLHQAARDWIECNLKETDALLIPLAQVYFEETKAEKIGRIAALQCDIFIDDLPEILLAEGFPQNVGRFLFDPETHHQKNPLEHPIQAFSSWELLSQSLL